MTSASAPSEVEASAADAAKAERVPPSARRVRIGDRWRGVLVAALVCAAVAALAQVPLIRNRIFYFQGDSAAQFLPMWYHLGEVTRHGGWPVLFDPNSWMGGNYSAEALFGIFNPIEVANQLLVSYLPDLAVAGIVLKTEFLAFLALGVYLVAREYGAKRWAAAPLAIALPFGGFTFYFEAGAWLSGLIAFSFLPHVWWSVRRSARGKLNPIWAFVIGALIVTVGNPYGVLGTVVVLAALLVEFGLRRDWRAVRRIVLIGVCIGLVVPLVFLPLLGTSAVTWRAHRGISNDGSYVPSAGDLLNMSLPTYRPSIHIGSSLMAIPGTYFAWFVMPLLPWLNWRALRSKVRLLAGPIIVAVVYFLLTLGPSDLWMFRWPLRLIECAYLSLAVIFAVALSAGLRTTQMRRRAFGTGFILVASTYLAWAGRPQLLNQHLTALAVVAALAAAAVWAARRGGRVLGVVLAAGTAITLFTQFMFVPENVNASSYNFPHSVQVLRDRFAGLQGPTMQLATPVRTRSVIANRLAVLPAGSQVAATNSAPAAVPPAGTAQGGTSVGAPAAPAVISKQQMWRHFLFGNMYLPAGVDAVNAYTGLGYAWFSAWFCMGYLGQVCGKAYQHLFRPTRFDGRSMADLLRLKTVVVDNRLFPQFRVHSGWHIQRSDYLSTVLVRNGPATKWPHGRLGYASSGLTVHSDVSHPRAETVRFSADGSVGTFAFARLNWPGYTATVDGHKVPVTTGPAGLIQIDLPAGTRGGTLVLQWSAPHLRLGAASAALGVLGALILGIAPLVGSWRRRRRRARTTEPAASS
jgi:hypothetical protein